MISIDGVCRGLFISHFRSERSAPDSDLIHWSLATKLARRDSIGWLVTWLNYWLSWQTSGGSSRIYLYLRVYTLWQGRGRWSALLLLPSTAVLAVVWSGSAKWFCKVQQICKLKIFASCAIVLLVVEERLTCCCSSFNLLLRRRRTAYKRILNKLNFQSGVVLSRQIYTIYPIDRDFEQDSY